MYGHPPPFRPCGDGGRGVAQPPQQQQIHLNPNFFLHQQNPSFLPNFNPFLQNPNSFPQNQQPFINNSFPFQLNSNNNLQNEMEMAVVRARTELLLLNENVSAWKASQAAMSKVQANFWESIGFQMQQVPSLNKLLVIEGKINAFIHCFIAVRRIASLYDLEVAICENEGIGQFEELGLGPLVRHPLVVRYFSVTSDVIEVCRITTEEIISYLSEFIDTQMKKVIKVDTFFDFVCEKKSVSGRHKLCVRVQDLGSYINHIEKVRESEGLALRKCYKKMRTRARKWSQKCSLFSSQKKQTNDQFTEISQHIKSLSSSNTQFCGEHIRFLSSSSDDGSEADEHDENREEKDTGSNCSLPLPNGQPNRVSSCSYQAATKERTRLGFKSEREPDSCMLGAGVRCNEDNELRKRKRKYDNISSSTSLNRNIRKWNICDAILKQTSSVSQGIGGHSLSTESLRMFLTTWKQTCRENSSVKVLERMLQFYNITGKKKKRVKELFTLFPFVGLLCAAVTCIKSGMWDKMYDNFQNIDQKDVDSKPSESSADYISIDGEITKKDVDVPPPKTLTHHHGVGAEDIAKKISKYFDDDILSYKTPYPENNLHFLRKLCKCEFWLIEQFSIKKFESLGYGEYLMFLEKYTHLLPHALQKCLVGDKSQNVSLEAHLLPIQLDVLLSQASNSLSGNEDIKMQAVSELFAPNIMNYVPSSSSYRVEVLAQQTLLTGRLGELVAFKYFVAKEGNDTSVNWVNETKETGLPYDIVLGDGEDSREYIEVKATKSAGKNWFNISVRQWQFAIEKGESFSIAHVVLADNNMARVLIYKNPARLCQLGELKLAFMVP